MFELAAPYPTLASTTLLPDPQFGDTEALTDEVSVQRAMDGTLYTFIKKKDRQKIQWPFSLTRNKALELLEFYRAYSGSQIRATDHRNRVWLGYITSNPLETTAAARGGPALQGWPRGENVTVTVEFEGTLQ